MIPFRPTLERIWSGMVELRRENRNERDYEVVVDEGLYREMCMDAEVYRYMVPGLEPSSHQRTVFGMPIEVAPRAKRGWIHLRHEVTR